jgi:protein required for attachment to host cells
MTNAAGSKATWVVVANGAMARIFEADAAKNLKEVSVLLHPQTRVHGRDLVEDKPGRTNQSTGHSRSAMEPPLTPQRLEAQGFAKTLCAHLADAQNHGNFHRLFIAASPAFLGEIRGHMHQTVAHVLVGDVAKDMTQMSPDEIKGNLPFHL